MVNDTILSVLAGEFRKANPEHIRAIIELHESQATVPFVLHYRADSIGGLTEPQITTLLDRYRELAIMWSRKRLILEAMEANGTTELSERVQNSLDRWELEDLYLPYRTRRRSKAATAKDRGLEPLAEIFWDQQAEASPEQLAAPFVSPPEPQAAAPAAPAPEAVEPAGEASVDEAPVDAAPADEASAAEAPVAEAPVDAAPADEASAAEAPAADQAPPADATASASEPAAPAAEVPSAPAEAPPPRRRIDTVEAALDGAINIMSEWIALNPTARHTVRRLIWDHGKLESRLTPEHESQPGKYETYHNFSEPLRTIPSHRLLAIRRGVKERWLQCTVNLDREMALARLREQFIINPGFPGKQIVERAVETAYDKLMWKTITAELTTSVNERADAEAIEIFCKNLRSLLLMPAGGKVSVIGCEASSKPEVRVAVVDADGAFVEAVSIFPGPVDPKPEESAAALNALIEKHKPAAIVVGNGVGSRTTDDFVRGFLKQLGCEPGAARIARVVVNESGANIYSTSGIAKEELKDLDPPTRCAVTIARRFQDPLAELVKIDPRAIGVGQYQHDVDQRRLREKLHAVVESCVNHVGVCLNTGSFSMLSYVAGFNRGTARRIVEHRTLNGPFANLAALKAIPAVNDTVFQQAAGFLRLKCDDPLEVTAIHPEHYDLARRMAADLSTEIARLMGDREMVKQIDIEKYATPEIGPLAVRGIIRELRNPGHDPRRRPEKAHLDDAVSSIDDLKDGMILEGTVTNVTNFGAFIDIGVHQDGLVHVSELSNSYIRDPNDAVKIGEVVKVKVLNIDHDRRRISLSIKQAAPKPEGASGGQQQQRRRKPKRGPAGRPAPRQQAPGKTAPAPAERVDRRPITAEDIKKLVQRLATR